MLAFLKENKNFLLFSPYHSRYPLSKGMLEGETRIDHDALSPSTILFPKGVLDWLSNVGTTTTELRNYVRYST